MTAIRWRSEKASKEETMFAVIVDAGDELLIPLPGANSYEEAVQLVSIMFRQDEQELVKDIVDLGS